MSRYWSDIVHRLTPYVPGEQPAARASGQAEHQRESLPAVAARARGDPAGTGRRRPSRCADIPIRRRASLRETVAAYHGIRADQVFAGNGSDEVLALTFQALLKHDKPSAVP